MNNKNTKKVAYRGKYISVVIQPKVEPSFWLTDPTDTEISEALLTSRFPIWTEVVYALQNVTAVSLRETKRKAKFWAFGTEMSNETKIPHYQIYLEFEVLVRRPSVYESLNASLKDRVHIVTQTVYNNSYKLYCLKESSNFNFDSKYYWNVKKDSQGSEFRLNKMIQLRPGLKMIKNNLLTGQKLLNRIAMGEPDDRTGIWLADVIGGTGKTAFFQTIVDEEKARGIYLRISDGLERLSSKLRKKITKRLEDGRGYPRFIWVNFGRTITEDALRIFADFGEQVKDGMLDDNFGNTSDGDFMALPYVNLIITANTPPNLKQLTGDRLKLLTLFPVYDATDDFKLVDSLLIPIYVQIKVRFIKRFINAIEYKYIVRLQDNEYSRRSFGRFEWYDELLENVEKYQKFTQTDKYSEQKYQSKMESDWITASSPHKLQQDVLDVYMKALVYSAGISGPGTGKMYVEATNFNKSAKAYYPEDSYEKQLGNKPNDLEPMFPSITELYNRIPD